MFFEKTSEAVAGINLGFSGNQRHLYQLMKAQEITDDQLKFDYENYLDHYIPDRNIRKYYDTLGEVDIRSMETAPSDNRLPEHWGIYNDVFIKQNRKFMDYSAHADGGKDCNPFSQLNTISGGGLQTQFVNYNHM